MECDPKGLNPRPDLCSRVGVKAYPTWVIGSDRFEGVASLDRLAEVSSYTGPRQ